MLPIVASTESYVRGWRQRAERDLARRGERAQEARRMLPRLIGHLVERYHARRVWLFGSLAAGGFHERSDIDLVVEGIAGAPVYRAAAELEDLCRGELRVDLIPAEDAQPEVLEKLQRVGELLHRPAPGPPVRSKLRGFACDSFGPAWQASPP
jgi:predicted nucleotidyltransferase